MLQRVENQEINMYAQRGHVLHAWENKTPPVRQNYPQISTREQDAQWEGGLGVTMGGGRLENDERRQAGRSSGIRTVPSKLGIHHSVLRRRSGTTENVALVTDESEA